VAVSGNADGYHLRLQLSQDKDPPFVFELPLAVTLEGEQWATRLTARVDRRQQQLEFRFAKRPLRIDIDPEYDLLRYLDPTEQPPALNRLFGGQSWLVLPGSAAPPMRDAWMELARQWQARYPSLQTIDDQDAEGLGPQADRILLGWDNRLLDAVAGRFAGDDQTLQRDGATIGGTAYPADAHSVVLVDTDADGITTGFIGADTPRAVQTLARKLTHYGSYGRLIFDLASGRNLRKDTLRSENSSLSRQLGPNPVPLRLRARTPLTGG
jgi:hypothetical protein